jgi:hypothetical protein
MRAFAIMVIDRSLGMLDRRRRRVPFAALNLLQSRFNLAIA